MEPTAQRTRRGSFQAVMQATEMRTTDDPKVARALRRVVTSMSEKSLIAQFASQVLLSERSGSDVIELTCDLVVADVRFNVWCASVKHSAAGPSESESK